MKQEPQFDINRATYIAMRYAPQNFKKHEIDCDSKKFREKIQKDLECYCKA